MFNTPTPWLWFFAVAIMLLSAVIADVRSARIPNAVVAGGLTAALMLSALPGGLGLSNSLAGSAVGLAVLLPLYLFKMIGAGDVKLLAAVGAFVGFPGVLGASLAMLLAGGVLSLAWAVRSGTVRVVLANLRTGLFAFAIDMLSLRRPDGETIPVSRGRIPYAIAIAAGAVVQLLVAGAPGGRGGL